MTHTINRGFAPIVIAIIAVLALGGGTYAVKKNADKKAELAAGVNATSSAQMNQSNTIRFDLKEQNNSGQSGQVVITEVNGQAKVLVNLTGKPSAVAQPAHIHLNSCASIGAVKYPLTAVAEGASQTMLDTSVEALLLAGPLSLNIHKSEAESSVYVACGDLTSDKTNSGNASTSASATSSLNVGGAVKANVNANLDLR